MCLKYRLCQINRMHSASFRPLLSCHGIFAHPLWHFNSVSGRMRPFH
jgi:hypothetical protein